MHPLIQKLVVPFSIITLIAALVSCGGGGGGSSSDGDVASASRGTVALLVTDAPTDDFKQINLTVRRAELLCEGGKEELFSGLKKFDLLQLTEVTEIFSVSEVSAGYCSKIRLTLAEIELVFKDPSKPNAYPKLPGNGKLDLNPRERFYVGPWLGIQLDFDAEKSIHIKGKADYNFRPVVFIKVIKDRFDTKLIRQRGIVENLNGETETFDLCLVEAEAQAVARHEDDDSSDDDSSDCVRVNTVDAPASIFDDQANPISFMQLEEGTIATVVGRFSFDHSKADDHSSDDSSSDDDSSDDYDHPGVVLAAEVIWTGDFIAQTTNIACSGATTNDENGTSWYENYELPVPENGEVCVTPEAIRTVLQPGAKIYDRQGKQLDESYIAEGVLNKVDAFADPESDPPIDPKAVLVMLDLNDPLSLLDQLTGTISGVDIDFFDNELSNLTLMTETGDRCINFDNVETEVFETGLDDDDNIYFHQKSVFSLMSGQKADVFGTENNGCLDAETIIYEEPEEGI